MEKGVTKQIIISSNKKLFLSSQFWWIQQEYGATPIEVLHAFLLGLCDYITEGMDLHLLLDQLMYYHILLLVFMKIHTDKVSVMYQIWGILSWFNDCEIKSVFFVLSFVQFFFNQ